MEYLAKLRFVAVGAIGCVALNGCADSSNESTSVTCDKVLVAPVGSGEYDAMVLLTQGDGPVAMSVQFESFDGQQVQYSPLQDIANPKRRLAIQLLAGTSGIRTPFISARIIVSDGKTAQCPATAITLSKTS